MPYIGEKPQDKGNKPIYPVRELILPVDLIKTTRLVNRSSLSKHNSPRKQNSGNSRHVLLNLSCPLSSVPQAHHCALPILDMLGFTIQRKNTSQLDGLIQGPHTKKVELP